MTDIARPALARLCAGPLALADAGPSLQWAEERANAVLALRDRAGLTGPVPSSEAETLRADGWKPYGMVDGVAVIAVSGLIVPELGVIGWQWATGCAELRWQLGEALADPSVRGIALKVNSHGGYVSGVDDTAAAIREAREAKPVASIVDDAAYSAAYWLASAADTISAPRSGGIGHVGVISTHLDWSEALAREGVVASVIHSGARKADAHPMLPLSDAARADLQARADAVRRIFAESVAAGRRGAVDVAAVLATEARCFDGPDETAEAARLGLIDAVLPADEALRLFAAHLSGAAG